MFNRKQSLEHAKYMLDDAAKNIDSWFRKNTQLLPPEINQALSNMKHVKKYIEQEVAEEVKKAEGFIHPGIPYTQPDHRDVRMSRERRFW